MESQPAAPHVLPNPRIPKVIGILNIVFASALMICGLCSIAYVAMLPIWTQSMEKLQKDIEAQEKTQRETELEAVAKEEKEATTEEEKARVQAKRKAVENQPRMSATFDADLATAGWTDPRVRNFAWVEFVSGIVLNLMMLIAGVGLVMRKMWGLKLGLWVAALKPIRLVLAYGYAAAVIVPATSIAMAKAQVEMQAKLRGGAGMPAGFTVESLAKMMSIWFASCAVAMILVGSIYPLISLWLLSRPSARAACLESGKAPGTDNTW